MVSLEDFFHGEILGSESIDHRVMDLSLYQEEMKEYEVFLQAHLREKRNLEIEEEDIRKRVYPEYSLEGVKSVLVFFIPYWSRALFQSGNTISVHAQALDYHIVVNEFLFRAVSELRRFYPDEKFSYQCDTGALSERFFAIQSGLCMRGRNGMAIHPIYGSYGFLGMILTTLQCKSVKEEVKECMNCGLCTSACPGNVLGRIVSNYQTCLSWLTQKKTLSSIEEERLRQNGMIYGCDICQIVCPHNRRIPDTDIGSFQKEIIPFLSLEEIRSYSNRSFKKAFGDRTFSWRGKKLLERNIELIEDEKRYVCRNVGSTDENF